VWEKFGRCAESLASLGVIPRGPFDPMSHFIPSGTSLSHGNAMKMRIVLLFFSMFYISKMLWGLVEVYSNPPPECRRTNLKFDTTLQP
jgi:hypothetical protein